jgi:hypothetical protein
VNLHFCLFFYSQKYPNFSIFRALFSLTYFDDTEQQAIPVMFDTESWEEMKRQIVEAAITFQAKQSYL